MARWPPTDGQPNANSASAPVALGRLAKCWRPLMCLRGGLTFDMSGGWKRAQPAGNRPLDGRVRRLHEDAQQRTRLPPLPPTECLQEASRQATDTVDRMDREA